MGGGGVGESAVECVSGRRSWGGVWDVDGTAGATPSDIVDVRDKDERGDDATGGDVVKQLCMFPGWEFISPPRLERPWFSLGSPTDV